MNKLKAVNEQTNNDLLRYQLYVLQKKRTDQRHIKYLGIVIIPLLRIIFSRQHKKWTLDKQNYLEKREQLIVDTLIEIKDTFWAIINKLEKEGLLKNQIIRNKVDILEQVLCDNTMDGNANVFPPQHEVAYERLKDLCCAIFDLGNEGFVRPYIKIRYSSTYQRNIIDTFCFIPSLLVLDKFDNDALESDWMLYDYFYSIEWSLNLNRDFFRKKELSYENSNACCRSAFLLTLHGVHGEVSAVKNKRQGHNRVMMYHRGCIQDKLKQLLTLVNYNHEEVKKTFWQLPISIELKLYDHRLLCFRIEWAPGIFEVVTLHLFQEPLEKNMLYRFIKSLLENPGQEIAVSYVTGATVKKNLERIGMSGIIAKIFFVEKSSFIAILKYSKMNIADLSKSSIKKIQKYIPKLKHVKWESC